MVTQWVARALLAVAARRWPADIRDEMHSEWLAELHVLASPPQPVRMLRFAASLALTRPRLDAPVPFVDPELTVGQIARHALLVLLALGATIHVSVSVPFVAGILLATVPVLLAVLAGATSPLLRPWAVVVAVVVPAAGVLLTAPVVRPGLDGAWRMPAATVVWAALLVGVLLLASRFSVRAAGALAGLGGLAACWLVSTMATLPHADRMNVDTRYAALWYPAEILWPLGVPVGEPLPDPDACSAGDGGCAWRRPAIGQLMDFTEGYPGALTSATAYVAAYVITAFAAVEVDRRVTGATSAPRSSHGSDARPG